MQGERLDAGWLAFLASNHLSLLLSWLHIHFVFLCVLYLQL